MSSTGCYDEARQTTRDAPEFRGCLIIKHFPATFICFQPHINTMAFIRRLSNQNRLFALTIADLIEEDQILSSFSNSLSIYPL